MRLTVTAAALTLATLGGTVISARGGGSGTSSPGLVERSASRV